MKELTTEQKQALRDSIIDMQEASGLGSNEFAVKRLGFTSGSKFSHVRNNWDKPGMVGADTWEAIEKYIAKNEGYHGVTTENLKKVWETCERAYSLKKAMAVIGEGGLGKTFAIEKYKENAEREHRFRVVYFDASMTRTNKQFVAGLMASLDCYAPGTMSVQLQKMRDYAKRQDMLICIDEVSSMEGHNITIIKDVMTAFKDLCGIVFTGTPYFINNLNKGAICDRHLFSETRDRIFMLPERLEKPTEKEAEAVFRANGINDKQMLEILLGKNQKMLKYSYLSKRTYRGIRDCIDMIRMAEAGDLFDWNNITL
jgi:nucleoside-triphosphatase THEP1